jgi:urea transporter
MRRSLDFFELFNDWLHAKEKGLYRHKPLWLVNATFKGVGQLLFCNNSVSGLLFLGAFASAWWVMVPYCLAGTAIATLTAFFLRQRAVLVGAGLFGYNGALIGLTWPCFWPLSYFSPPLLILASGLSTLLAIVLMKFMSNSKINIPILSIPFALIFLTFLGSAYASGLLSKGAFEPTLPSLKSFDPGHTLRRLLSAGEWLEAGRQLLHHGVTIGLFFAGILVHSRLSALLAFVGGTLSFLAAFLVFGPAGAYQLELHGFTSVPIAVALGGFFIALNVPCFFYSLSAVCLGILLWLMIAPLLTPYGLPVLTLIFNAVTLLFILPLKYPCVATRIPWLFAVSLERAVSPEKTLHWYRLHREAVRYWKVIR